MGDHKFNPTAIAAAAGRLPRKNHLSANLGVSIQLKRDVIVLPPDRIRQRIMSVTAEVAPYVVVTEVRLTPEADWSPVPDGKRAVAVDQLGDQDFECVFFVSTLCQHGAMVAPNGRPVVTEVPLNAVLAVIPLSELDAAHKQALMGAQRPSKGQAAAASSSSESATKRPSARSSSSPWSMRCRPGFPSGSTVCHASPTTKGRQAIPSTWYGGTPHGRSVRYN